MVNPEDKFAVNVNQNLVKQAQHQIQALTAAETAQIQKVGILQQTDIPEIALVAYVLQEPATRVQPQ